MEFGRVVVVIVLPFRAVTLPDTMPGTMLYRVSILTVNSKRSRYWNISVPGLEKGIGAGQLLQTVGVVAYATDAVGVAIGDGGWVAVCIGDGGWVRSDARTGHAPHARSSTAPPGHEMPRSTIPFVHNP